MSARRMSSECFLLNSLDRRPHRKRPDAFVSSPRTGVGRFEQLARIASRSGIQNPRRITPEPSARPHQLPSSDSANTPRLQMYSAVRTLSPCSAAKASRARRRATGHECCSAVLMPTSWVLGNFRGFPSIDPFVRPHAAYRCTAAKPARPRAAALTNQAAATCDTRVRTDTSGIALDASGLRRGTGAAADDGHRRDQAMRPRTGPSLGAVRVPSRRCVAITRAASLDTRPVNLASSDP